MKNALKAAGVVALVLFFSVNYSFADCATSTAATSTDQGGLGYVCSYHYNLNGTLDSTYKNGCFTSYTETFGEPSNYVLPAAPVFTPHQAEVLPPWKMVAVTL